MGLYREMFAITPDIAAQALVLCLAQAALGEGALRLAGDTL